MSNSKMLNLGSLCRFLKYNDNYLILTHSSPDGDTLGSAYALALGLISMGKRATVKCSDEIPRRYKFFIHPANLKDFKYETVIAVDVADAKLLGSKYADLADKIDLNIDHHISNTGYAKNLYLDSSASATAECIYALLKKMHVRITPVMATALYTGIATDTGCFKYANVTAKTHEIAAELYKLGIDAAEINHLMFDTKSKARLELEKMVLETAEFHFNNKCILLPVTAEMQRVSGCEKSDLDGVAVISRSVEGVLAGISVKEQIEDGSFKISLRTYEPLDASAICQTLGGGGHKAAAGCTLHGSLEEVKAQILSAVEKALEDCNAGTYTDK